MKRILSILGFIIATPFVWILLVALAITIYVTCLKDIIQTGNIDDIDIDLTL